MPILKSELKLSIPSPTNSITLLLTYPFAKTEPIIAKAISWGPTPLWGEPVKYTPIISGILIS